MPLVYDEALYNDLYRISGGIHYERAFYDLAPGRFVQRMDNLPGGVIPGVDVLVVGCGFGWLIEHLLDAGINAVGVDSSPYVQAQKALHARNDVDIIDATVGVDDVAQALADAGHPTTYNFVIDDDAASSHSDAELPAFWSGLDALGNVVVHFTSPRNPAPYATQDSRINFKTVAEWQALRPGDLWVDARWSG